MAGALGLCREVKIGPPMLPGHMTPDTPLSCPPSNADGPYGLRVSSDRGLRVGEVFTVDLGGAVRFDCSADSNPPNVYSWIQRDDNCTQVIEHGPHLEVALEGLGRSTDYMCRAYNNVTGRRGEAPFTVIITSLGKNSDPGSCGSHSDLMLSIWRRQDLNPNLLTFNTAPLTCGSGERILAFVEGRAGAQPKEEKGRARRPERRSRRQSWTAGEEADPPAGPQDPQEEGASVTPSDGAGPGARVPALPESLRQEPVVFQAGPEAVSGPLQGRGPDHLPSHPSRAPFLLLKTLWLMGRHHYTNELPLTTAHSRCLISVHWLVLETLISLSGHEDALADFGIYEFVAFPEPSTAPRMPSRPLRGSEWGPGQEVYGTIYEVIQHVPAQEQQGRPE
ncbi:HEPACAM family member 2 [Sarcophilus harrisii]|uniref:HEPACAM family member 2 n=1 Tax=Sarcophilus harrisii TaxID=9305 RepID=UPI001301DA1A|nr:HEPACAM family member 2 [Sarcophilus harrisii]